MKKCFLQKLNQWLYFHSTQYLTPETQKQTQIRRIMKSLCETSELSHNSCAPGSPGSAGTRGALVFKADRITA